MKTNFLLCLVSAILGGILAIAISQGQLDSPVVAQQATDNENGNALQPITRKQSVFASDTIGQGQAVPLIPARKVNAKVQAGRFSDEEENNIAIYENVNRSVVNINTTAFRRGGWFGEAIPQEGSGSGWVIDKAGHIVTNHHVIVDSDVITVTLFDGDPIPAEVVGADKQNDIALLKITAPKDMLIPVTFGDSSKLRVGQKVVAIGNPFGLERTMTVGIVSSLGRSLQSKTKRMIKDVIQIDAALNQGNSGGPLLDNQGTVIGMNTAIATLTGQNTGVGFAVPVNTIKRIIPQLLEFGEVLRGTMGIDMFFSTNDGDGLGIGRVIEGGPADRAGLQGLKVELIQERRRDGVTLKYLKPNRDQTDKIISIDGVPIHSTDDYLAAMDRHRPGDEVDVICERNGKRRTVRVRLGLER